MTTVGTTSSMKDEAAKVTLRKDQFGSFFQNVANECTDVEINIENTKVIDGAFICTDCGKEIDSDECCKKEIVVFVS